MIDVQRRAGILRIQAVGQRLQAAMGNPFPMTYKEKEPLHNDVKEDVLDATSSLPLEFTAQLFQKLSFSADPTQCCRTSHFGSASGCGHTRASSDTPSEMSKFEMLTKNQRGLEKPAMHVAGSRQERQEECETIESVVEKFGGEMSCVQSVEGV